MKRRPLYTFSLIWVLSLSGCTDYASTDRDVASGTTPIAESDSSDSGEVESKSPYRIVFLGDSITAGFGIDGIDAFPALIQRNIDSLSLPFTVVNAGISGDTSTGGLKRLPWLLRNSIDILILELGGNDGLRGVDLKLTYRNLADIIMTTKKTYPGSRIIIAGMQVPPNLGQTYTAEFRSIFPRLAEETDSELIPFLLESVGGIRSLNQPDQIHPTAEGHRIIAATVWKTLLPVLKSIQQIPEAD
jgi:acyl-CoA thioesterase I